MGLETRHQDRIPMAPGGRHKKIAFSPDGNWIAYTSERSGILHLWHTTNKCLRTHHIHDSRVNFFTFSPDGSTIATGSGDGNLRLFSLDTGADAREKAMVYNKPRSGLLGLVWGGDPCPTEDWTSATAYIPGGHDLVMAFYFGSWIVFDVQNNKVKARHIVPRQPVTQQHAGSNGSNSVTLSPGADLIAMGRRKLWGMEIEIRETGSGALRKTLKTAGLLGPLAFSPNGKLIALASYLDGNSYISIWDTAENTNPSTNATTQQARAQPLETRPYYPLVEVSSDGSTIAGLLEDGEAVIIHDAETGRKHRCEVPGRFPIEITAPIRYSPDTRHLAASFQHRDSSGFFHKKVLIWNTASRKLKQTVPIDIDDWVGSIEFDSSGSSLTINNEISARLNRSCRTSSAQMELVLARQKALPPRAAGLDSVVSMSPDGAWMRWDGVNVLWLPPDYRCGRHAFLFKNVPLNSKSVRVVYYTNGAGIVIMTLSRPESLSPFLGK